MRFIFPTVFLSFFLFSKCAEKDVTNTESVDSSSTTATSSCSQHNAMSMIRELPEVIGATKYIDSISKGTKSLSIIPEEILLDSVEYYQLKVGYSNTNTWEGYYTFYVNKYSCSEIKTNDILTEKVISLEEWRRQKLLEKCYDYLTEMVRSSSLSAEGIEREKINLLIDKDEGSLITVKAFFDTHGTGTLGWITYNPEMRMMMDITADPENPVKMRFDTTHAEKFEKCRGVGVNRELLRILSDSLAEEPELKYLYASNGGLIGFYSDGAVRGCPRCDPYEEALEKMQVRTPHATYSLEENGLVIVNSKNEADRMSFQSDNNEWLMLNGQMKGKLESVEAEK